MTEKKYTRLSDKQKWYIIFLREEGLTFRQISDNVNEKFGLNTLHTTVGRVYSKYRQTGDVKDLPKAGRPNRLNQKESEILIENIEANPFQTLEQIKSAMEEEIGPVADKTIRKELKKNGFNAYSVKRREISEINRNKRIKFAEEHKNWVFKDWKKVIFTDESDLFPKRTQCLVVRRRKDEVIIPPHEKAYGYQTIKVWGFLTGDGVGKLYLYEGMMDMTKYTEIVERAMAEYKTRLIKGQRIFMQDGASCHQKALKEYFPGKKYTPMVWPPNSPDLYPIENIWSVMKQELWKRREEIKNKENTWRIAQEIWYNLPEELIKKIYRSLPGRIEKVIQQKGLRIKTK